MKLKVLHRKERLRAREVIQNSFMSIDSTPSKDFTITIQTRRVLNKRNKSGVDKVQITDLLRAATQ